MILESEIRSVVVIGAGTMGHGIAQVAAMAGMRVVLTDRVAGAVERGMSRIRENLDSGVEKGKVDASLRDATLGRVTGGTDFLIAVASADLVIEAVPERMDLKCVLFQQLDQSAPDRTILATNTSSLSVTEIAGVTCRPDRVIGMHFFNPPHILKLLELVRGDATSSQTMALARTVGELMGKTVIEVKDFPGFATSRLGIALGNEAMRMVEQGVASPEDIDTAMELGYRHPMGPLRLSDHVGLDVRLKITEYLYRELGGEQFRPPLILKRKVAAGKLGVKSGEGFYVYPN